MSSFVDHDDRIMLLDQPQPHARIIAQGGAVITVKAEEQRLCIVPLIVPRAELEPIVGLRRDEFTFDRGKLLDPCPRFIPIGVPCLGDRTPRFGNILDRVIECLVIRCVQDDQKSDQQHADDDRDNHNTTLLSKKSLCNRQAAAISIILSFYHIRQLIAIGDIMRRAIHRIVLS